MKLIQNLGKGLIVVLCCISLAQANDEVAETGPREAVEFAANQVIDMLQKQREEFKNDPQAVYRLVHEHILPHFDFDKMSYFVLGKTWKNASEQQKADFQKEFKHLLVSTYTTALSEYSTDGKIIYLEVKRSPKNENVAIVPTEIHQKGAGPIAVAYRMYYADDVWRIYDVAISGVSLVTNYRANFAGQVRNGGIDSLISSLSAHNESKEVQPAPVSLKP